MTLAALKDARGELANIESSMANDFPLFASDWTTLDTISYRELSARKAELHRMIDDAKMA